MVFRKRALLYLAVMGAFVAISIWLALGVRQARRMAIGTSSQGRLNQLSMALHNYHDTYGQFPPAFVADENGKPIHSWRVLILPFIEEQQLYKEYRFDEPWDGPHNVTLSNRMPVAFHSPSEPPSKSHTNLVVITGPQTIFPGSRSTCLDDIRDGQENTILLTEVGNSMIPWLAPQDLSAETMSFRVKDSTGTGISCAKWRQPYVVFADSITAYSLMPSLDPDSLRALTTISGREPITRDELEKQSFLKRGVQLSR